MSKPPPVKVTIHIFYTCLKSLNKIVIRTVGLTGEEMYVLHQFKQNTIFPFFILASAWRPWSNTALHTIVYSLQKILYDFKNYNRTIRCQHPTEQN